MTLDELFELPASGLEAFTTKQLEDFFNPYLDITRPDRASAIYKEGGNSVMPRNRKNSKLEQFEMDLDPAQLQKMKGLMKELDIDLKELID